VEEDNGTAAPEHFIMYGTLVGDDRWQVARSLGDLLVFNRIQFGQD